jgi:hypothetical protein
MASLAPPSVTWPPSSSAPAPPPDPDAPAPPPVNAVPDETALMVVLPVVSDPPAALVEEVSERLGVMRVEKEISLAVQAKATRARSERGEIVPRCMSSIPSPPADEP